MTPTDFMSRVVVWPGADDAPGWINAHWLSPKGPGLRGRPFKTLHSFMEFIQYAVGRPSIFKEIFFCTSTQKDHGKEFNGRFVAHRHAEKALAHKCLFIDADAGPGKSYPTIAAALAAVTTFVKAAGLPPPTAIVITGGGVHVYWISNRPLAPAEWSPLAEGLKAEAIRLGLKCDPISADPVRVLRPPGTFNNKMNAPRPVRLAHLAATDLDFSAPEIAQLAAKAPPAAVQKTTVTATATPAFHLPPEFANGPSKIFSGHVSATDVISGIGIYDPDVPLKKDEVFKGCFHFQESYRTGGAGQSQSLWHLTALACTWLEGGREIFHKLSKGYPTYNYAESNAMFDRKVKDRAEKPSIGWPLCKTLEAEGAKCKSCPYYNRIKSPLNLAERAVHTPPAQVLPPATEDIDLPSRYTINGDGLICEIVEKEDRHGNSSTQYVPLFWCKLKDFQAQADDRKLLFKTSLDMGRWGKAEISEAADLINEASIIKALRQHGVKPNTDISAKKIITFMTSFMARLDASRERQKTLPFGWLRVDEDGSMPVGFAYGGRIALVDGKERPAGYSDRQLENFYTPKGKDKPWWDLLHVVTARHHPALECIIAASFAAPLSYATGLYNGIINSWSPGSGAHKTTSMQIGSAVWGSPKLTKEKPDSSKKGVIHKMGLIKNLPVYWDEINDIEKMKTVVGILGSTEGSGGSKLTSGRDLHVYDEWQTLMQVGANRSLVEHVIESKTGTDAQLQRVFEYQVEKRPDTEKHYNIDGLTNALDYNYGHMGIRFSALLGRDVVRIHGLVKSTLERFANEVSVQSEERFRCAIASTLHVGAVLANELGCNFNTDEIWQFLKVEFLRQRGRIIGSDVIAGTSTNSQNWFTQFLKTFGDNAVWIDTLPQRRPGTPPAIIWIAGVNQLRPRPIHIRLSVSDGVIDVSRTKFFEWLVLKEATPNIVLSGLIKHFGATEPGRLNLAAGAGVLGGGREPIIRIPVPPDSPWYGDLMAHTPPEQRQQAAGSVTATVIPIDKGRP